MHAISAPFCTIEAPRCLASVFHREKTALEVQREPEHERPISLVLLDPALVHDPKAEHARAVAEAFH